MSNIGEKYDQAKPRWSLVPEGVMKEVIAVLEYGAAKYDVDNWQHVDNGRVRYYDAAMRHIDDWYQGADEDHESGLPHLAHAICNLMYLLSGNVKNE